MGSLTAREGWSPVRGTNTLGSGDVGRGTARESVCLPMAIGIKVMSAYTVWSPSLNDAHNKGEGSLCSTGSTKSLTRSDKVCRP